MPFAKDLDPSKLHFSIPDFGFNDSLNSSQNPNIWNLLYNQIRILPKYERLNNLILELAERKKASENKAAFLPQTWLSGSKKANYIKFNENRKP